MAEIDEIHTQYPYMGQRRIVQLLRKANFQIGRKLVRSYMQQMGICAIYPRIGIREYIDEYNSVRPHEAHEYATPDEIYYSTFRTTDVA